MERKSHPPEKSDKETRKMPNKRSDDKRLVAFWFTHQEAQRLAEAASNLGINMTDFVKKAVSELILKEQLNERKDAEGSNGHNA